MQAIRIHPSASGPYSESSPASASALVLDRVPIPELQPRQVLVRVHAATVTRDELTWPESYKEEYHIPGYDLAGVVSRVHDAANSRFKPGDEVYAFAKGHRGSTWAEYAVVDEQDLSMKPKNLSWEESASVPMSALTAWQALFVHAGYTEPSFDKEESRQASVVVTGASGAVGAYMVQLAALAGLHVIAVSSSNERNGAFLRSLGAGEVAEYAEIVASGRKFDTIIDTVGGDNLRSCWSIVTDDGSLISVDSSSFDFAQHPPSGKERVRAFFFILVPSGEQLEKMLRALEAGKLRPFVAYTFPLADARAAYEKASGRFERRGKVVLTV